MSEESSKEVIPAEVNPLLERVYMPGETFTLPSCGLFYKDGELSSDVVNGEITINPMTAYDEIVIRTPDLLFSGKAIDIICERCVPQILKPQQLLAKDVDFILLTLRKVTYGDKMEVERKHDCNEAQDHSYIIDVNEMIRRSKRIDPTTLTKKYTVTLPNDQVVELNPARYGDVIKMFQDFDPNKEFTAEREEESLIDSVLSVISSVDGIERKDFIAQWLRKINSQWTKKLSDAIHQTADWGPSFETTVVCKDCGEEYTIEVPANPVSFFSGH